MLRRIVLLILAAWAGWAFDCPTAFSAEEPAPAELEFFEKRIRPLLIQRCGECHDKKSGDKNGELALDSGAALRKGGSRGKLFVVGKPEESLLIKAVRYADEELQMPPEGKLAEPEIALLTEWVRRGAALPNDAFVEGATKGIDIAAGKTFWSFQPLQKSELPAVKTPEWAQTRTDRFILARLEANGITPAAEADRRTLLRRLAFDLTGLPPSMQDVDEFIADTRPDAYERVVDRLLRSPRYGERVARPWLDLARYTDTVANWLKGTENAWLYRDWVVQSMNEDRSYDEFVRLQLAADQISNTSPEDLAALGFLGLSPTYWKELRLAPNVIQTVVAEEWDERIDAVSRTFLGLTVSCARCHNHKFDPVTVEDYYGLAGVFASSQLADRPLLSDAEAEVVRKARDQRTQWEAELKKIEDKSSEPAKKLQGQIAELVSATPNIDRPWAHVVEDASVYVLPNGEDATKVDIRRGEVRDVPIFRRGSPSNLGDVIPRRFLAVLSPGEPARFQHGSGRIDLADAIMTSARPLSARVIVNRVWAQHFGRGLVSTVSDFGRQGERPSHPELLDDLALRFLENGGSLRWLHRELVLSATYRQQSTGGAGSSTDPDNRWLGRMPRRRLDVEAWRDAILAGTDQLDSRVGGPSIALEAPANNRRTLYGTVGRHEQNEMLKLYDFPEPSTHSPNRVPTTTPLQQLFVLNSPFVERCAAALADMAAKPSSGAETPATTGQRIEKCYQHLVQRKPTAAEVSLGVQFLGNSVAGGSSEADAWKLYALALLSLNEVMFVD
jgi:hypothetical protein